MSEETHNNPIEQEQGNVEDTPLDLVQEQKAMQQQNREVVEQREEPSPEVPGDSHPSTIRHHPQRQMYGQGTNES